MIKVENLHKSFGDLEVLKGVSEHIKKGEVFKMPDGLRISVTNQTIIRNSSSSHPISFGLSYISYFGGWKGSSWHNYIRANCVRVPTVSFSVDFPKHADRSWDKLFKSSR